MNLLIVEDDPRVADFLRRGLSAEGYNITLSKTGNHALETMSLNSFDLIILDLILPDITGLEVCQELRLRRYKTPILILSALESTENKIKGLRFGADDYLTKPFDVDELLARIDALIRRSHKYQEEAPTTQLKLGLLVFDRDTIEISYNNIVLKFTAKELAMIELMMNSPGKVFSREKILNRIWGYSEDPLTNIVDVYIRRIRSKFEDVGAYDLIKTVRGVGYKLESSR